MEQNRSSAIILTLALHLGDKWDIQLDRRWIFVVRKLKRTAVILVTMVMALTSGCFQLVAVTPPLDPEPPLYCQTNLEEVRPTLPALDHADISLGYDASGNVTAWVTILSNRELRRNQKSDGFQYFHYHPYIAKQVLDAAPELASVRVFSVADEGNTDGEFTLLTRKTHVSSGLQDASLNKEEFRLKPWWEEMDSSWFLETPRYWFFPWHPKPTIKKLCMEYFGDRLLGFPPAGTAGGGESIGIAVNGLPEDLEKEIAEVFCLVRGLTSDVVFPLAFILTYEEEGVPKLKLEFDILRETPSEDDRVAGRWTWYDYELFSDGPFPISFWIAVGSLDETEPPPVNKTINVPSLHSVSRPNLSYIEIMNQLIGYDGVEVEHLGYGGNGLTAVLIMQNREDSELHRIQTKIAMEVMQMPITTLHFIVESDQRILVSSIDRQRYDIIQFIGDKVTISHEDWPILAKYYWEEK